MILYHIPDIRLFWTRNPEFLEQFQTDDYNAPIIYKNIANFLNVAYCNKLRNFITPKPIKPFPKIVNDMAMWLPEVHENQQCYDKTDFYDLVREIGGDIIEKVELIDDFYHKNMGRQSHCYRITYRHPEMAMSQSEVTILHRTIGDMAEERLKVDIRR
uniref:phenylalanine--tRNA ligase n=1 Tax=Romanomermis culicivorax TaxID=13658 RepID=A0A915KHE1_ROMCU